MRISLSQCCSLWKFCQFFVKVNSVQESESSVCGKCVSEKFRTEDDNLESVTSGNLIDGVKSRDGVGGVERMTEESREILHKLFDVDEDAIEFLWLKNF